MRSTLLAPLVTDHFGPVTTLLPLVDARLVRQGTQLGPRLNAIVDSGSALTLARLPFAYALGLTDAELDAGPAVTIAGVGGKDARARGVRLDLWLGPTRNESLVLQNTWVFFADVILPMRLALLVGQHDALERLHYAQLGNERRFVLRLPE